MPDENSIAAKISAIVAEPKSASNPEGSFTNHDPETLIDVDKHLATRKFANATRSKRRGLLRGLLYRSSKGSARG